MFCNLFKRNEEQNSFAKEWNEKYPFLRVKHNDVCLWHTSEDCWFEDIPIGWVNAFGKQMCDELMEVLGKYSNEFVIAQMKEKFGDLRIYWYFKDKDSYAQFEVNEISELNAKIHDIVEKYNKISAYTCAECGAIANYSSTGWILPYCEEHAPQDSIKIRSK